MTQLLFFEKPGCATNTRQKQMLRTAGIEFEARSLLSEPWTRDRLQAFFDSLPVAQWFNRAAPRVKSGDINPDEMEAEAALGLLLAEPLLIRRPLLQHGDWRAVGFDWEKLSAHFNLGFDAAQAVAGGGAALEGCSHGEHAHAASCPAPQAEQRA